MNTDLFLRIRASGELAALTAKKVPALLSLGNFSANQLHDLLSSLHVQCTEIGELVQEAGLSDVDPNLFPIALRIETLWNDIANRVAVARIWLPPQKRAA